MGKKIQFDAIILDMGDFPLTFSNMYPERRANLAVSQVGDQMVVLDREAGQLHQLNGVASFVWECCDGATSLEGIVSRLREVYDISREVAEEDVAGVIGQFTELGLLLPAEK